MEKIKAAENLVIELGKGLWQLSPDYRDESPLLIASIGSPTLAYRPAFARARRLPTSGGMPVNAIREVVVGWARSDRSWHLGLLLGSELAESRGGRWCELAHWPDDFALQSADQAERAGAVLSEIIRRPFRFVEAPHMAPATGPLNPKKQQAYIPPPTVPAKETPPPKLLPELPGLIDAALALTLLDQTVEEVAGADWMKPEPSGRLRGQLQSFSESETSTAIHHQVAQNAQPQAAIASRKGASATMPVVRVRRKTQEFVVDLPLELGGWTLQSLSAGLQWARTVTWSFGTIVRIFFNIVLGMIFIGLSMLTLDSEYAPVEPMALPYLGIVVGAIIIYFALRLALSMLRTEATVIDKDYRQVRRHLDLTSDVIEAYDFEEIRAVVVSQVAQQERRGRDGKPNTMTHEAWLHLLLYEAKQKLGKQRRVKPHDAYVTIGHINFTEGEVIAEHFEGKPRRRLLQLLYPDEVTTSAQKAALAMACAIGVDAYIDQR